MTTQYERAKLDACVRMLLGEEPADIAADIGKKPETVRGWWLERDEKGRSEVYIAVEKEKLRLMSAQHMLIMKRLDEELDSQEMKSAEERKPGRVHAMQVTSAIAFDKIQLAKKELADLEAKLGTGRQVRPKNSHKVAQ